MPMQRLNFIKSGTLFGFPCITSRARAIQLRGERYKLFKYLDPYIQIQFSEVNKIGTCELNLTNGCEFHMKSISITEKVVGNFSLSFWRVVILLVTNQ